MILRYRIEQWTSYNLRNANWINIGYAIVLCNFWLELEIITVVTSWIRVELLLIATVRVITANSGWRYK